MSRNNNYTIGNLLDSEYFSKHYKLIGVDLSNQIELEDPYFKKKNYFIGTKQQCSLSLGSQKTPLLSFRKIL